MRKKFLLFIAICLTLVLSLPLSTVFAKSSNGLDGNARDEKSITKPYEYPVKLKTEQWKKFKSRTEKIEACAIPESILNNMKTKSLVETVMNYPLLGELVSRDTRQEGFDAVHRVFNGLQELVKRTDAISELEQYQNKISSSKTKDSRVIADEVYVEILLECIAPKSSIVTPTFTTSYVTTPNGTKVSTQYNRTWSDNGITAVQAAAIQADYEAMYPNATVVGPENPAYNCHSYAWYLASSYNMHWINAPNAYMTDGSYIKTTGAVGCKVWYGAGDHSGIVIYVGGGSGPNVNVRSKWGALGLFEHNIVDCPYTEGSYSCTFWKRP